MQPLFTTEEELKQFLPTTASFRISGLAAHLLRAQQRHIREALGFAQLLELGTAYAAGTLTPALTQLLALARLPLASYAYAYYLPVSTSQLGATGTVQTPSPNQTPAGAALVEQSQAAYMAAGDEGMEALLEYLEEKRADYPLWAASDACTVNVGQLVATAREFDQSVFIDRSRKQFRALQPGLQDAERLAVLPLLGRPLVEELKAERKAGSLSAANKLLLSYVRPVLTNLAMQQDEFRQQQGQQYLDDLQLFLYDHAPDYPLFIAHGSYQPEIATQLQQDTDWGFHAAL